MWEDIFVISAALAIFLIGLNTLACRKELREKEKPSSIPVSTSGPGDPPRTVLEGPPKGVRIMRFKRPQL